MTQDPEITPAFLQAHPVLAAILTLYGLTLIVLMSSFFFLWGLAYLRLSRGQPLLAVEPWRPRAWGLIDLLLVLGAAFLGQAVLIPAWSKVAGIDLRKMVEEESLSLSVMAVGSVSYLVAMACGLAWLVVRYQANAKHLSISIKRFLPHFGLGLAAAAMALPIVALISGLVNAGLKAEYDHPLINELQKEGTVSAYLLAVFCAVVVAPLVEEFFFRVLLQGWMESLPWSARGWWWLTGAGSGTSNALINDEPSALDSPDRNAGDPPLAPLTAVPTTPEGINPYQPNELASISTGQLGDATPGDAIITALPAAQPPVWPSIVVGILFGLAHYDYGLSFIPLIALGIVLGLLYRAKHSIWPCFILHFTLNSFSMGSLGIALLVKSIQ